MYKTLIIAWLALFIGGHGLAQELRNFTYNDLDDQPRTFQELKGEKVTVIDFWTTWCKPCKKAIPELNSIYSEYKGKGVEIIGVNCDGPRGIAKVAPVSSAMQIQYPVLIDIDSELMNELNLTTYPSLIMVDAKGKIAYVHEGFVSGDELELREKLESLLQK